MVSNSKVSNFIVTAVRTSDVTQKVHYLINLFFCQLPTLIACYTPNT